MNDTALSSPPLPKNSERHPKRLVLRAGVTLSVENDQTLLTDSGTGLHLVLGADAAALLSALAAGSLDGDSTDVVAFVEQLFALGLFEPTPVSEAIRAQGEFVFQQARAEGRLLARETVERAVRDTRLHREQLGAVLSANPHWRLEDLPLLYKADIRRHFPNGLISDDLDLSALLRTRDLVIATTSGTTGERLQVYSDTRIPRLPPNALDFWGLSGVPRDRPVRTAILTSPNCSGATCSSRLAFDERISFEHTLLLPSPRNPFHLASHEVRQIAREMREFAADFWLVNPVYLAAFAERARECGEALPPISAILYTYQYLSHCQRRVLSRHFDAPVIALYTATELGGSQIGVGCREGRLHVRLDQVFVELLDRAQPVTGAELGSVTVTSHNPTMPLVRYALGDLARMTLVPCGCQVGSSWPALTLEGRKRDAFVVDGRLITTKNVDDALADSALAMYQLSETTQRHYRLEAIPEKSAASGWRATAEAALRRLLEPRGLLVKEVGELPLDDSQKFRFTCPLPTEPVR